MYRRQARCRCRTRSGRIDRLWTRSRDTSRWFRLPRWPKTFRRSFSRSPASRLGRGRGRAVALHRRRRDGRGRGASRAGGSNGGGRILPLDGLARAGGEHPAHIVGIHRTKAVAVRSPSYAGARLEGQRRSDCRHWKLLLRRLYAAWRVPSSFRVAPAALLLVVHSCNPRPSFSRRYVPNTNDVCNLTSCIFVVVPKIERSLPGKYWAWSCRVLRGLGSLMGAKRPSKVQVACCCRR